ncbi:hypothetical protein [Alistipes sp.]
MDELQTIDCVLIGILIVLVAVITIVVAVSVIRERRIRRLTDPRKDHYR